jgi:general secretion pathway protein D
VKTTLLAFFVTCLGLPAQTPPQPGFPETPPAVTDTNRDAKLQEALRRAAEVSPKAIVDQTLPAPPATNLPAPAASRALPFAPRTALRPVQPATSETTNATSAAPPAMVPATPNPATPVPPPPSVAVPALPGQPPASSEPMTIIRPSPAATNAPPDELLPAGVINFPATDLNQVLKIYAELVNRTVLRPTALPAPTITLVTQTPLTKREAKQAFDAVLALNGIAMIDVGDKFVKVVPTAQAGQVGAPFSKQPIDQIPDMGQYVTHIVQLTNAKPSEMVQALTPFASPGQQGILPIDSSQILVLRDYSENVKRMLEMIKKIDVAVPAEYISEVIPIKYALASDIASALNSLSSGGGGTTVGSAGAGGGGARGGGGGARGSNFGRGSTGTYPGSTTPGMTSPFGATPGATTPGGQPGGASSFTQRLQNLISRASVSGEIQVLGQTKIIADERTNSLLIFASREDMKMIKDIVSKLDVVLAQVLIEAVIAQVSLDDSQSLGVSYLQKTPSQVGNSFQGIGALNNKNLLTPGSFLTSTGTNVAGNLPGGFSYLATLGNNDLDVSVTALAGSSKAKILQRPRIQTSHAVPATLFVGEQRPYPVSSYYGGGAFGGYASIQQLQIGVTIEVTPLINPDGLVVMDIHTKIDSFEGNVTIQNVGDVPVTSSKDATAKVAVRDRDTIMLGGLIQDTKTSNNSGIPLLKDIPLLGYLFRSSSADNARQEMIVLIRPTVLPTPEVAALAARAEKDKMPAVRQSEAEIEREQVKRLHKVNQQMQDNK